MCNFFNSISCFYNNSFTNPHKATVRHIFWQIRKIINKFPCELKVEGFKVIVKNKVIANGCGCLINAMGYYDHNNMYFIDEVFTKGVYKDFIDIGANIGIYSLIASYRSIARVFSIEPHPFTYDLLKENISLNKLACRVTPYPIALSNFVGYVHFTDDPGSCLNKIIDKSVQNVRSIQVPVTTGDSFCKEHTIKPDILKIDAEGHENSVISGFQNSLADVKFIIVECQNITETSSLLNKDLDFLGPYKIDYKNRLFDRDLSSDEDWVFVNKKAVKELESLSFNIK